MKVSIIITTKKPEENGTHRSKVWEGILDIKDDTEYLMLISVIAEGVNEPICQVPFAKGIGHYVWVPDEPIREMGDYIETEDF